MIRIIRGLRTLTNSFLRRFGLQSYALRARNILDPTRTSYRNIKTFSAVIEGVHVQFRTDDEYSNSWFYPRYAGQGKIHERKVAELFIKALDDADCFVDVGANLGWYTCLAGRYRPETMVYGFEMVDLNFVLLEKNVALNDCANVELHNLAVSDTPGLLRYKQTNRRPGARFRLRFDDREGDEEGLVTVRAITLDDFFAERERMPDVIKIDVEGAEMNVLRGMKVLMERNKPILFLEIHPKHLFHFNTSTFDILSMLIEYGYSLFEVENMREQEGRRRLKALSHESKLNENTMIYGVADVYRNRGRPTVMPADAAD